MTSPCWRGMLTLWRPLYLGEAETRLTVAFRRHKNREACANGLDFTITPCGVMIHFECTVQDDCVADDLRPKLASVIEGACREAFGHDEAPVEITWTVIPKGFGFRGGQPSTTSQVRGQIPDGCDRETRSRLLRSIGDSWCEITGASPEELMVSARDRSWSG